MQKEMYCSTEQMTKTLKFHVLKQGNTELLGKGTVPSSCISARSKEKVKLRSEESPVRVPS